MTAEKRAGRFSRWWLVALLCCLFILSCADRLILTLFIDPIKADLSISDAQAALLLGMAFGISYAAFGIPIAWLVDKINRKLICTTAVLLWSTCTVVSAFVYSFESLVVLRIGVAIGEAALSPTALSLIGDRFRKDERTLPIGMYAACGAIGNALAFVLGGVIDHLVTIGSFESWPVLQGLPAWRTALVLVGAPGIVVAVLFASSTRELRHRDRNVARLAEAGPDSVGGISTQARKTVWFFTLYFCGNALIACFGLGTSIWYPTYLLRKGAIDRLDLGYALGIIDVLTGILLISVPYLISRRQKTSPEQGILASYLLLAPFGLLLFLASFRFSGTIELIFFGASKLMLSTIASCGPIVVALTAPPHLRGRLAATSLLSIFVIGMGLGPSIVAGLSTSTILGLPGLAKAMMIFGLLLTPASCIFILFARRVQSARLAVRAGGTAID